MEYKKSDGISDFLKLIVRGLRLFVLRAREQLKVY